MGDTDPVLAVWANYDRSEPGWDQAKKAIDAYQAGDLITATWRAQAVHDAWGHVWADLAGAFWALHPKDEAQTEARRKPRGRLAGGVRAVLTWVDAVDTVLTVLIIMVMVVVAIGIGLLRCAGNVLP